MGLDTVELVMEIEDTFHFSMPDADAQKLQTVGDIYEYICQRVAATRGARCDTQRVFYGLRSALMGIIGVQRAEIRRETKLGQLLPAPVWRGHRQGLANITGLRFPHLIPQYHRTMTNYGMIAAALIAGVASLLYFKTLSAGVAVAVVATLATAFLTAHYLLPRPYLFTTATVGELVQSLVALNPPAQASPEWTEERVWVMLKQIIIEQLDVTPEAVTKDAHIIKDLGADG